MNGEISEMHTWTIKRYVLRLNSTIELILLFPTLHFLQYTVISCMAENMGHIIAKIKYNTF